MANEVAIDHLPGGESSARVKDKAMARIAQRQHGVVARRQLLELGMSGRASEDVGDGPVSAVG